MNKKVLVVDDQYATQDMWCVILGKYGQLNREGYKLIGETAFDGFSYSAEKVIERIGLEGNISAMVLDMDFNYVDSRFDGRGFGEHILGVVLDEHPSLPVIIHSSTKDEGLKRRCLDIGAKEFLEKMATYREMKEALDIVLSK